MLIAQGRDGLGLDNDSPKAKEVGLVSLTENLVFVAKFQLWLRHEGNALQSKFDFQALRINALEKTATLSL